MSRPQSDDRLSKGRGKARSNYFTSYIPDLSQGLAEEYRKFNQSLSKEQREALGVRNPADNPTGEIRPIVREAVALPIDADNMDDHNGRPILSALVHNDQPAQEPAQDPIANRLDMVTVLEVIRRLLTIYEVSPDSRTRLHGEIIALALGVPGSEPVSDLARKYNTSRQTVSKRLVRVIESLDLPPTWRMLAARESEKLKTLDRITKDRRKKAVSID